MTNKARSILQAVLDKRLTPEGWRPYQTNRHHQPDEYKRQCGCVLQHVYWEAAAQADETHTADQNQYVAMVPVYKALASIEMDVNNTLTIGVFNDRHTLPEVRSLIQKAIELSPESDNGH